MQLTLLEILEATGGGQIGGTMVGNTFTAFHTDSREVGAGGVFFALRGAEKDGHEFVEDALDRGAAALVVERSMGRMPGIVQVLVPNTWEALYALARFVRDRVRPMVLAVTGSNGKTSTKEMVAAILASRHTVLRTSGNLNTETGVPLTMLRLEPEHTALVLEMGMQRAGEIGRLVSLAEPSIGIVTNIGTVHMEFFASQDDLARAKGELVAGLPEAGFAVLNADDAFYELLAGMTPARVASFGADGGDYRVERYRVLPEAGCAFTVRGMEVRLAVEGRHQALNAVAALAAGDSAGVPFDEAVEALSDVVVEHRLQEVTAPEGYVIVDDAYNASPESMLAAFETMADRPREGRLLAVLGRMGELGALADEAHLRIGRRAGEVFDAVCVLDGAGARILAEAAGGEIVPDRAAAAAWVKQHARKGDRVLVKASHSLRLDQVVDELTQ
ncbi:MAG TPA: UDP-N-acetylmuramoyl-tripeptide--D-alanyl-D-alanine ligase [Candidatus Dormibacteraeota bacterium]|nr:UDP-N-acetylmuramoyl-tripeptide--D-alanyl-D-alanine ligase [Candidatus Dormibacteraeota bacterium]